MAILFLDTTPAFLAFNIGLLTIQAVFYTLSNLRFSLKKRTEGFLKELGEINKENKGENKTKREAIRNFIDEITTTTRQKNKRIVGLLHRMGVLFRTGIYSSLLSIVLLFSYAFLTEVPYVDYFLIPIILLSTIVSSWIFIQNTHQFKYIYHYDLESNMVNIRNIIENLKQGYMLQKSVDEFKEIEKRERMEISMKERIKYLWFYNPFK